MAAAESPFWRNSCAFAIMLWGSLDGPQPAKAAKVTVAVNPLMHHRHRHTTVFLRADERFPALDQYGEHPTGAFAVNGMVEQGQAGDFVERGLVGGSDLPVAGEVAGNVREVAQTDGRTHVVEVILETNTCKVVLPLAED